MFAGDIDILLHDISFGRFPRSTAESSGSLRGAVCVSKWGHTEIFVRWFHLDE